MKIIFAKPIGILLMLGLGSLPLLSGTIVTNKGTVFKDTKNKHGHILKSRSYTIYVGKDCDVDSPQLGKGYGGTDKYGSKIYFGKK